MAKAVAKKASGARLQILDAAEELFAQSGFDGVPVRLIAKHADVALSVVTYHFPSKEQLIDEVVTRRSNLLNSARRQHLSKFILEDSKDLVKFAEAFTRPFVDLIGSGDPHWRSYGEILAQAAYSAKYSSALTVHFDFTAHMFADALKDIYGHTDELKSIQAVVFCISVMLGAVAAPQRVQSISDGKYEINDLKDTYPRMLRFIAGGIRSLMES